MILTCDQCFTRYLINSAAIPEEGRIVQCAKCGYSWHQQPDPVPANNVDAIAERQDPLAETASPASPPPLRSMGISAIPAGSGLPVIRIARTPPIPFWIKLLPIVTLLMIALSGLVLYKDTVLRALPQLQPLYTILGMYETTGITLQNIVLSKEQGGIYLYGTIINNAPQIRILPPVRITLLDTEKRPFASYMLPSPKSRMEPTASFPLHSKLPATIDNAAYITVETGNKVELFLR